jgi:quinol monooxygenase YgiN
MPGTEIGADMSGRRRRDDGWDEGRRDWDATDSRPDPWADAGADGRSGGGYPAPSFQPATEQATSYDLAGGRNGNGNGNGYDASAYDAPSYGDRAGYGGQNGAVNGYQPAQPAPGYGGTGYGDSGYDQGGYGYGNESGYGGRVGFADANGATAFVPEFMAADADDAARGGPAGTPRPIGRLSIYTLLDDKVAEFDRLAERAAEGVRMTEPDTLVYVIHVVPKAPMQRIVYEIYRDRAAFESHERQPHIQRFMADRASCVLATNIIDLRLKYAKVTALGTAPAAGSAAGARAIEAAGQSPWPDAQPQSRTAGPAAGGDLSGSGQYSAGQYSNGAQYNGSQHNGGQRGDGQYGDGQYGDGQYGNGQYGNGQYGGEQATVARSQYQAPAVSPLEAPAAASFTPAAEDRYTAAASQYAAAASGQYSPTGQYGYAGGGQAANGGQYPAAAEYAATSGYSESAGYQGTGYQATAGYQANGGYAAAGAGYSGAAGYSGGTGYQSGDGYSNANGYASSNGYSAPPGGAYFTPASSASSVGAGGAGGLGGGQYQEPGGQPAPSTQVAPVRRYRELGSGAPSDSASGYQASGEAAGGGYAASDTGASRSESEEWSAPGYSDQRYRAS